MENTVGMRIRECRVKMGITQEELADMMCTKKSTISSYELGKNDVKVGILEEMAPLLGTTVSYLAGGESSGFSPEVMQIAMLLEGMQNAELRRVAMEQAKYIRAHWDRTVSLHQAHYEAVKKMISEEEQNLEEEELSVPEQILRAEERNRKFVNDKNRKLRLMGENPEKEEKCVLH